MTDEKIFNKLFNEKDYVQKLKYDGDPAFFSEYVNTVKDFWYSQEDKVKDHQRGVRIYSYLGENIK